MLLRRTYNFLYKYLFFVFNIDWYRLYFKKSTIISNTLSGTFITNILNDKNDLDTILKKLETCKFLSIGFIDELGNIITPHKLHLNQPVKTKTHQQRKKFVIELIVLPNHIVALKKVHNNKITFFREVYAMSLLRENGLFIPEIYDYNIGSKEILMEYIDGINLKNLLAINGAAIPLENLYNNPVYLNTTSLKKYYARTKIEKEYLKCSLTYDHLAKIKNDIQTLFKIRMIYQDVKYGNFMIHNSKVYWIDFEHCKKHNFISQTFFRRLYKPYDKKFKKHFELEKIEISQLTGE